MAAEVSGTLSLVSRDAPGGFVQAVASAILDETPGLPVRPLSTVAEMCAAISNVYDASLASTRPQASSPRSDSAISRPAASTNTSSAVTALRCAEEESAAGRHLATGARALTLWVVSVPDLGGVARHVLDAARAGVPGYRLIVVCPEGPLAAAMRAQGSAVVTASISPADSLPRGIVALRKTIRSLRPAVVHSHLAYSDFVAAAATFGSNVRLVTTEHGIAGDDLVYHGTALRSRMMAAAHHLRLHRFNALIAVSEATLEAARAKWRPAARLRTWVIPNGVDVPACRYEAAPGRLHVVSLARLASEKGLADLVEAFVLVRAARPEATLTLAGEGPLRGDLQRKITELDLADSVSMPGYVDADRLLARADVLVQLSVWENCSYSLLDALAAGLHTVTTAVGGNPERLTGANSEAGLDTQLHAPDAADNGSRAPAGGNTASTPSPATGVTESRPERSQWPSKCRRVVFVAESYPELGGVTTFITSLGSALSSEGIAVDVLTQRPGTLNGNALSTHSYYWLPQLHTRSITGRQLSISAVLRLPLLVLKRLDSHLSRCRLRRLLRPLPRGDHTLVVVTHPRAAALLRDSHVSPRRRDLILVGQFHSSATSLSENKITKLDLIEAFDNYDAFIALTKADSDAFSTYLHCRCTAIPNPIAIRPARDPMLPIESRPATVAIITRLAPEKRIDVGIRLFLRATSSPVLQHYKLNIYGDGPELPYLRSTIASLGQLGDRVILMGVTNHPTRVLQEARLLMMTSAYEGLPMSILEAASCGVPTIAFACSSGVKMLTATLGGVSVDQNDEDSFVESLASLLTDGIDLQARSTEASLGISEYSTECVMQQWGQLAHNLIRKN